MDAAPIFLGDRIPIAGIALHDRIITVALFDRALDTPFLDPPSVARIRQFRLVNGALVELPA